MVLVGPVKWYPSIHYLTKPKNWNTINKVPSNIVLNNKKKLFLLIFYK